MPVFRLSADSFLFPPPQLALDDGLLAIGGDLHPQRLLNAYANGIFPWYNPGESILWWCPHERFVIFPDQIHISRSMRKFMKATTLTVRLNTDFPQIIHECRMTREGETWLDDDMEAAYTCLHKLNFALCVGVYSGNNLVGGLYGVVIGKCFFGESMFSKETNASKLALIFLCQRLAEKDFLFVDCQFHTPHLESMGGQYIDWKKYALMLKLGTKANILQ